MKKYVHAPETGMTENLLFEKDFEVNQPVYYSQGGFLYILFVLRELHAQLPAPIVVCCEQKSHVSTVFIIMTIHCH